MKIKIESEEAEEIKKKVKDVKNIFDMISEFEVEVNVTEKEEE